MPTHVYVHGGVSGRAKSEVPDLGYAVAAGWDHDLALDAVEAATRALEDDPTLNAGWGSVLNREGKIELDAGIADGRSGNTGGVLGVVVRNPITLARRVMEHTPHVLLSSAGAMAFGRDMEVLEGSTEAQQERYRRALKANRLSDEHFGAPEFVDTVGAVALDSDEGLAAASSTGGVFAKMPGRVGDSAIFGAGTYASMRAAVVGTGVGELFLETLACARTGALIEEGEHPQMACERIISWMGRRSKSSAALLAVDTLGRAGACYRGGSWSVWGPEGRLEPTLLA